MGNPGRRAEHQVARVVDPVFIPWRTLHNPVPERLSDFPLAAFSYPFDDRYYRPCPGWYSPSSYYEREFIDDMALHGDVYPEDEDDRMSDASDVLSCCSWPSQERRFWMWGGGRFLCYIEIHAPAQT